MNENCSHSGRFEDSRSKESEKKAGLVALITFVTMLAEIFFGLVSGSMALLADGIHMGTHALALLITVITYVLARKLKSDPSFTFGTGKIKVLGGYTNSLFLGGAAFFMVFESIHRLIHPESILYNQALAVAVLGLLVNLFCALILAFSQAEAAVHSHHTEKAAQGAHIHPSHQDSNLKAAFVHVLADALTSVLAIAALFSGKYFNWNFMDPAVSILGAGLIFKWSWGLLKETGALLLDFGDYGEEVRSIRQSLAEQGSVVQDIHIWRYSENHRSLMLTVKDARKRSPDEIRSALSFIGHFDHVTIEVCTQ